MGRLHTLILRVLELGPTPMPVPEIVARVRALEPQMDVDDATVRLELRVLRGQLRVAEQDGGWRLFSLPATASLANVSRSFHGLYAARHRVGVEG